MYKNGDDFLNKTYKEMYLDKTVHNSGQNGDEPSKYIHKYLERISDIEKKALTSAHKKQIMLAFYYDKYVIKKLPDNIKKTLNKEEYTKILKKVQEIQKSSLTKWLDYFWQDNYYPAWFKSYAFQGMLTLNKYDAQTKSFGQRTEKTIAPFIELNINALDKVYNSLKKVIGNKVSQDVAIEALNGGTSFKKLYTYYINEEQAAKLKITGDGKWLKFPMGSNPNILYNFINGKNSTWCTANKAYAISQLKEGDFYIYCTKDENNKYTVPRIAIRLENGDQIKEIRGIGPGQNLEPALYDVLENKLSDFSNCEPEIRKLKMARKLDRIWQKNESKEILSLDDLLFIHEMQEKFLSFGEKKDPRIIELKKQRSYQKDCLFILKNCQLTDFIGNIYLNNDDDLRKINLPTKIRGNVFLHMPGSLSNYAFNCDLKGNFKAGKLTSLINVQLPSKIKILDIYNATNLQNVIMPNTLETLYINNLDILKQLKVPHSLKEIYVKNLDDKKYVSLPNNLKKLIIKPPSNQEVDITLKKTGNVFKRKLAEIWTVFKESMEYNQNIRRK